MNRQNRWIAQAWARLRELHGGKCLKCGTIEQLEFAHVEPTELKGRGRGRKERYYDILKNPKCYTLLCHDCHHELDNELDAGTGGTIRVNT